MLSCAVLCCAVLVVGHEEGEVLRGGLREDSEKGRGQPTHRGY